MSKIETAVRNEYKNIVTRWNEGKAEYLAELTRLMEGFKMVKDDIQSACGQSVDSVKWEENAISYTIGRHDAFSGSASSSILGSEYRQEQHWHLKISELEGRVRHLQSVSVADLRVMAEAKLSS